MDTPSPVYVLDTNVFVQAHRRHYAFDICPGFWDCLIHHHQTGRIVSIDRVRDLKRTDSGRGKARSQTVVIHDGLVSEFQQSVGNAAINFLNSTVPKPIGLCTS